MAETLGIALSRDRGRFSSRVHRKVQGSPGPDSPPVRDDLLDSFRSQGIASTSEPQEGNISRLLGFVQLFHVTFGESYEQAAKRELKEETGVSAPLAYLGKFSYHVPPENEMVAVFFCKSDKKITIDQTESSKGSFHMRDEVNAIAESEEAAPWLRRGWKMLTNSNI